MSIAESCVVEEDGKVYYTKFSKRLKRNDLIAEFYRELHEEEEVFHDKEIAFTYSGRADRVENCCKFWEVSTYERQRVKSINSASMCHDRFCPNCQSVLASVRQNKFSPLLDEYAKNYDIYHVVLTVPNMSGEFLRNAIKQMYKKFVYLVGYFSGKRKIAGVPFEWLGYTGAVRALEVTFGKEDGTFHPHFHCCFIFKKGLEMPGEHINDYSYKYNPETKRNEFVRAFSDFEILIQRIWYLLYNNQKVTKEAIEALPQGYSCTVDAANSDYSEVFKYSLKGVFDEEDKTFSGGYESFKYLHGALLHRRCMQGYGALFNVDFEDLSEETDTIYEARLEELEKTEKPKVTVITLSKLLYELDALDEWTFISKSIVRRRLLAERRESCNANTA